MGTLYSSFLVPDLFITERKDVQNCFLFQVYFSVLLHCLIYGAYVSSFSSYLSNILMKLWKGSSSEEIMRPIRGIPKRNTERHMEKQIVFCPNIAFLIL